MCEGFSHFSVFLHYFVLTKFATSSIRINGLKIQFVALCHQVTVELNDRHAKKALQD